MRARVAASVLAWLAAVASVAGIAWLAIDTAGQQVTAISTPLPSSVQTTTVPATTAGPTAPATRTVEPRDPAAGSDDDSPTTSEPARQAPAPRPAPTRSATSPPIRYEPVTSTYTSPWGRIQARCTGQQVTLDGGYVQPAPGWTMRVPSGGPGQIEVDFFSRSQPPVRVLVTCVQGRPRFQVERPPDREWPSPSRG